MQTENLNTQNNSNRSFHKKGKKLWIMVLKNISFVRHHCLVPILSISIPGRVIVLCALSCEKVINCTLLARFLGHSVTTRKQCKKFAVNMTEICRWGIVLLLAVHRTAEKTKMNVFINYLKWNVLLKDGWTLFDERD